MTVLCHLLSFDWFLDESSTAVCFLHLTHMTLGRVISRGLISLLLKQYISSLDSLAQAEMAITRRHWVSDRMACVGDATKEHHLISQQCDSLAWEAESNRAAGRRLAWPAHRLSVTDAGDAMLCLQLLLLLMQSWLLLPARRHLLQFHCSVKWSGQLPRRRRRRRL